MVGDILRREREKQGLTIADVAEETSIRSVYLEAIEGGNYDTLPGDVYTRGFIRNYSKFLQIDGDSLLEQYASERNIAKVVQPVDMPQAAQPEKPRNSFFGRRQPEKNAVQNEAVSYETADAKPKTNLFSSGDDYRNRLEREKRSGSQKFMIFLGVMLLFLGGVYIAFMDSGTDAPVPVKTEKQTEPAAKEPEKVYENVEVTAKFLDNCWLSVKADGETVFEGTAEKGAEMNWQGKESVDILAGNAGGVELTFNGKSVGSMGQKGQIAERHFAKETTADAAALPEKEAETAAPPTASRQNNSYREPAAEAPVPAAPAPAPAAAPADSAPVPAAVPAPAEQTAAAPAAEPQN